MITGLLRASAERPGRVRAGAELGWLVDTAIGKEESFIVFLGDSEAPAPPSGRR